MTRFLALLVGFILLMPASAFAAAWTDVFTGTLTGTGASAQLKPGNVAYIVLPSAANDDSISPVLRITHLATFCMDTNFATLPGVSEGAGEVDVLLIASDGNLDGTDAASMGTMTAASPCLHAGPGDVVLQITVAPDSAGGIVVVGY